MFEAIRKLSWLPKRLPSSWRITRLWIGDSHAAVKLSLLRIVAVSQRERIDLAPLLGNLASEHRGIARRRLRRIAKQLSEGTSFVAAVEQSPEVLSDEDVLFLRFATQTGTLATAYEELIDRLKVRSREATYQVHQSIAYGICLALVLFLIMGFLMLFISPVFAHMFEEFGLRLPFALDALIRTSDSFVNFVPLALLLGAALVLLSWFLKPIRSFRRWLSSRVMNSVAQLRISEFLRMLALAADAGRPTPASLSTLGRYHFDEGVRIKLLFARNEIEQGSEIWTSMAKANLLTDNEAGALANASSAELRTWMLRLLADQKEEKVRYQYTLRSMLVHPAIVLSFGALVAWVSVAFFGVLTTLINSLA